MKNLKFNLKSKSIVQKSTRWLLTLIAILTLGTGQMWGGGWFTDGMWQVWGYKTGYGSDGWLATNMGKNSDYNIGVITWSNHTLKGLSVNTYGSDVQYPKVYWHFPDGTENNSKISWSSGDNNKYWESKGLWNYSIDQSTPGDFTIDLYFKLNSGGDDYDEIHRKITWTIPGFTSLSTTSVTFDNTTVGSNSSKSITYTHYGTAPTKVAERYSITGTNANQFSITALNGTGATIRFAPTSAGTKTAKLVINDVHGKQTAEITLTGTTQYTVSYNKGSYGTGDNTTANKVYGTNLTLLGATFTRTGFVQTAWNTNPDGESGTSYDLGGSYTSDAGNVTLYPTWTQYTITDVSISPDEISPSTPTDITFSFKTNAPTGSGYKFRIKELTPSASAYGAGYEANDQTLEKTSPTAQTYVKTAVSRTAGTYKTQIELYKDTWSIATSDITLTVGSGGGGGGSSTWYWIGGNGAHNGGEVGITKAEFTETATAGVYTLTRELTQNQQFHLGDGSKGYGPQTPANSDHTNVTATSSNINLAEYGPVYWFTFTPATQEVMMTLNTNASPMTLSFSSPSYTITYYDQGGSAYSGTNGGSLPSSYTYGTGIATLTAGVKAGYTFVGWYDNPSCTGVAVTSIGTTATGAKTLYAKWTENITTVGLVANPAGAGTFTSGGSAVTSVSAGVATKPSVTAVAATGYYVKTGSTVWTEGDNNITLSDATTNPTTITGAGANGASSTLTATFSEKYVLRGSTKNNDNTWGGLAGWGATDNSSYVSHSISNGVMTIVANLTSASTDYKFKIYKVQATATYYGQTGSSFMPDNNEWTLNGSNDVYFTTTIAGNYTFVVDVTGTNPKVKILFPGEPEYSTTVQTDGTPNASVSVSSVNLKPSTGTEISATVPAGYRFAGWTSTGGGISFTNPSSPTTTVTASSEGGTITANFTTDGMIYLKKTGINGPWPGKVWVYFYTGSYWDKDMGSGSKDGPLCREMTRLGQTDIYYYNYGDDAAVTSSYINSHVISFTDQYLNNVDKFYKCSAIYRTDFNTCATMFVVENYITDRKNSSAYYNNGYWMKYNSTDPGVTLHIWKKANNSLVGEYALSSVVAGSNEYKVNVTLDGNTEYYFKLSTCNGQWYGNNGTMTTTNSTGWDFLARNNNNCYITTTAHAGYPFTVTCTDVGVLKVSVEFPLAVGDYRVMYYGKMNSLGGASNVNHPSRFVRGLSAAGTKKDMVSFFAIAGDNEWTLQLQKCGAVSPEVRWDDVGGAINLRSSVSETGVHNFVVEQSHNGSTNTVSVTYGGKYSGNYYIRTDCAAGGWEAYKETADNQMTYSDVAKESGYDYYYCHWVETPRNIQFTVANDYSEAITLNYVRETESEKPHITNYINADGTLNGRNANVRFMYNSSNNYIGRAYIDGANESDNNFLKLLSSDGKLYSGETGGSSLSELKFSDNGNWIYEADVYSLPDAQIKLRSNFGTSPNEVVQWFKGGESETVKLIGGTGSSRYKIRVVYDFKTNRLVSAWLPSGELASDQEDIYSDIMFIREHQGDIEQVTFNNHRIDDVQKVYGVMRFTKETLNNSDLSEYTRRYYYISFPYDVDLNEAFGFGQYAQHWIICEYNGSRRASEGFWADSESHWEYIWDRKGVILEKNKGYLLELELSALGNTSSIWDYTNTVELYFPSQINVQTIQPHQVQVDVPSHLCTIGPRFAGGDDRRFKDSHWNLVGVPTYVNESPTGGWDESSDDYKNWVIGDQTWPAGNTWATTANYLYEYQFNDNTWRAVSSSGYVFHAMHAYLMQYAGTLVFNAANSTPSQIAARRNANYKGKYEFRLELQQNGVMADQTYISLLDVENITTGFDFNSDLSKEFNGNKPNIYTQITTVIDNEVSTTKAAGNCLPLETESVTAVPVGVRVKDAGTYTFSMPDGTEGMAVTLLDSETGVHTDLSVGDYTVELQAGSCEGRFYISIDPRNAATQIDVVGGEGDELRNAKILRNGMLFIQRGETLYDATGKRLN